MHLDSRHQRRVIIRTIVPHAVDEKGRCGVDAAADAAHEIAAHLVSELARLKRIAASGSPSSAPIGKIVVILSGLWFSNKASCISQNSPAAPANSALSAAISACGCISVSGK